jgi:hypothetical protein
VRGSLEDTAEDTAKSRMSTLIVLHASSAMITA